MYRYLSHLVAMLATLLLFCHPASANDDLRDRARLALRAAATYYADQVASHGGYVYFYSLDLQTRWGEGLATADQIWIQPPGTPTVGLAFLRAYEATGDTYLLDAATAAARALIYGQLRSGGWRNCIDFDPSGSRVADYRNGRGNDSRPGARYSSLDDDQSQAALRLMMHVDRAHDMQNDAIHAATQIALDALLTAQFANGAFPQGWTAPAETHPVIPASYPDYDWRSEGLVDNYWDMYTLNDDVPGGVARALIDAHEIYGESRYLEALQRLGDFLCLAQMPLPQPAWAQQYGYDMKPIWARRFEPPAIAGDETQETIATLLTIFTATGDTTYLQPIPAALDWLRRSRLSDGRLARYYELRTNRPLFMTRRDGEYSLTYDDTDLPRHYGWKTESRLPELEARYAKVRSAAKVVPPSRPTAEQIQAIVDQLDAEGRWISTYGGERLVGQPKMTVGASYLSSQVFSDNLHALSEYLLVTQ